MEKGLEVVSVGGGDYWVGVADVAGVVGPIDFSMIFLHLRGQNISSAPIQSICCTCSLFLNL